MSTPEERVQDGMRLTLDAHVEGRLETLQQLRDVLLERHRVAGEIVEADGNATDRMKARGALEAIEELLGIVDEEIEVARTARDA
jgi:hypothetical protein